MLLNHAAVAASDDLLHRRIVVGSRNGLDIVFAVVFSRGFHTFVDDASCHCISAGDVRVIETFYLIRQFLQSQFVLEFLHQPRLFLLWIKLLSLLQPVEFILFGVHLRQFQEVMLIAALWDENLRVFDFKVEFEGHNYLFCRTPEALSYLRNGIVEQFLVCFVEFPLVFVSETLVDGAIFHVYVVDEGILVGIIIGNGEYVHVLNLGLTLFALINLDEFDKITQRQQVVLKYLVSTSDVKYRPPYGTAYSSHRRYASFIGTTNELMPLTDPTGSRRFICVMVDGNIDFETPVEYGQLYAQLKYEVEQQRERYFLTKDEEAALMHHNLRYQRMSGLGEMLLSLYEKPDGTPKDNPENGRWVSVKDIAERMKQAFKGAFQPDEGTLVKIGQYLSRPEYCFESERKTRGWVYWVKER